MFLSPTNKYNFVRKHYSIIDFYNAIPNLLKSQSFTLATIPDNLYKIFPLKNLLSKN